MNFSGDAYIRISLKVGTIFFISSELIKSSEKHPFVVIGIDGDTVYLSCGSSQEGTVNNLLKNPAYLHQCFIWVKPDGRGCGNGLEKTTFFDCNVYYEYEISKLAQKFDGGGLVYAGMISEDHFEQITIGVKESKLSDLPHTLLVYQRGITG